MILEGGALIWAWTVAWRTFVKRFTHWRKLVIQTVRNTHVPARDAQDVQQDVYVKVLRYWSDAHEIKSPPGYLLRIATNESRNYHVAARNRMPHEPGWLDTLTTEDERDPAAAMADAERRKLVCDAIRTLTARQQQMLTLHVFEHMTYDQIAQHLGLSSRTVLRELVRSYGRLRILLAPLFLECIGREGPER